MTDFENYPIDHDMTERIGQPGLTIVKHREDGALCGIYTPTKPIYCNKCGCIGNKNGFAKPRRVIDLVSEDPAKVMPIYIQRQRFVCPACKREYHLNEISYDPEFGEKGSHSTNRLNEFICRECLDKSPESISKELGEIIGESQVRAIFRSRSERLLSEYGKNVIAPKEMGIHYAVAGKNRYYLITDLNGENLVDIFAENETDRLRQSLVKYSLEERTSDVVTDLEYECLINARGGFDRIAKIRAANISLYRIYTEDLITAIDKCYSGKNKRLLKMWLERPLFSDTIRDVLIRLSNNCPDQRGWIESQGALRYRVIPNWNRYEYEVWKAMVDTYAPDFETVRGITDMAKHEISESFDRTKLQSGYADIHEKCLDLILRSQKSSFAVLRARLLLSLQPKITTVNGMRKFVGISVEDLWHQLPVYKS